MSLTCSADSGAAVNDNGRSIVVPVPRVAELLGALRLCASHVLHEGQERLCRLRHAVIRPARKLQVRDLAALRRLQPKFGRNVNPVTVVFQVMRQN